MIRGLYTSSAGMQVEVLRQESIANNLANLNTTGFKREIAIMQARENKVLSRTNNPTGPGPLASTQRVQIGELGTGVLLDGFTTRFEAGNYQQTDNPFDFAIEGDGYFVVAGEQGEEFLTRAGDFTLNGDGYLTDKAGRLVLGQQGPIGVPRGGKATVGEDGVVTISGRPIAQLRVVSVPDPETTLEKVGDTLFRYQGPDQPQPSAARVRQGMLETANVNSVEEMTRMITALRHYEANQKAVQHQDETLAKAVNEIARG